MAHSITIRHTTDQDRPALRRLAERDGAPAPAGEALAALVDGELLAALPLDGGRPLADPFHHTEELLALLRLRAEQEPPAPQRNRPRFGLPRGASSVARGMTRGAGVRDAAAP